MVMKLKLEVQAHAILNRIHFEVKKQVLRYCFLVHSYFILASTMKRPLYLILLSE